MTEDEIEFLIRSKRFDDVASYAARGRKHASLDDTILLAQWKAAMQILIRDPKNVALWQTQTDLLAELDLRRIAVPQDLIDKLSQAMQDI